MKTPQKMGQAGETQSMIDASNDRTDNLLNEYVTPSPTKQGKPLTDEKKV